MSTTTVFGIPVHGSPDLRRGTLAEQKPIEDLEGPLRAALEVPNVTGIRWRQYTPYFNDGEPCEFGTGEVTFGFTDTSAFDEDEEDGQGDYEDGFLSTYELDRGPGHYESREKPHPKAGQLITNSWDKYGDLRYSTHYPATQKTSEWVSDGPKREGVEALKTLAKLIGSGAFENALYEAFGDHAIVTVRKDKIDIEFYDHD